MRDQKKIICWLLEFSVLVVSGWSSQPSLQEPGTSNAGAILHVVGLRTEAASEALGIDTPAPRFSWRVEASQPAIQQTAFQVIVATSSVTAESGEGAGLVWDSKVTMSSDPFIVYNGPALSSRTRYYWTVRLKVANQRQTFTSSATWFETAYMDAREWRGDWISGPKRLETMPTKAQSLAADACCLRYQASLAYRATTGQTNIKVSDTDGIVPGLRFTFGQETVTATKVGTAAVTTTLRVPAEVGDTTAKVASVHGFREGQLLDIGPNRVIIKSVGSSTVNLTLALEAAAGTTRLRLNAVAQEDPDSVHLPIDRSAPPKGNDIIQPGETLLVDGETYTVSSVDAPTRPADSGESSQPLLVTITPSLLSAQKKGAIIQDLGSGIKFAPALFSAKSLGTSISSPGSGIDFVPPLRKTHAAGSAIIRTGRPVDYCRPQSWGQWGTCTEIRPAPMLRKSFMIDPASKHGIVIAARVYSSGLAFNNMSLNGTCTSQRFIDPPFTNYSHTVYYRTEDVTKLIRQKPRVPAKNVIATQLGSGYFDHEGVHNDWGYEKAEWRETPRIRTDLYIQYEDGTEQVIKSDGTWRVSIDGPTRYDGYHLGETYDARKAITNWDKPNFDDTSWLTAWVVAAPQGNLRAQRGDPTMLIHDWPPGKRTNPAPGVFSWDMGKERSGWATISVYGAPAGTPIQIAYSDQAQFGWVSGTVGAFQVDHYISNGTGTAEHPELFMPQFTFKGYRYITISAPAKASSGVSVGFGTVSPSIVPEPLPRGVNVNVVKVNEVRTALQDAGTFSASNSQLTKIENITRASVAENYVSGISTDTPQYEKNGWTGDTQLVAPTASLLFNTERQYWKSVQDMIDGQAVSGDVSVIVPSPEFYRKAFKDGRPNGSTPVWDAFWFVIPWESFERFGDVRFLQATYPLMLKYLDVWLPQWTGLDSPYKFTMTSSLGDWVPPNGSDAAPGSPEAFRVPTIDAPTTTAYWAYEVKIAADSARALGKTDDARRFDLLYANIKRDFNSRWWDETVGYYRENATEPFIQGMAVLPLAMGLVPEERRAGLQAKLVEDILKTREGHAEVGIASMRWMLPVLSQADAEGVAGAADAAYAIMAQTTYPSYGYWLGMGWTGLGESWEKNSRTRSHQMYGSPVQWLYENLVGIQAMQPGYKQIAFRPTLPRGLNHAEATFESVRGKIAFSWTRNRTTLTMDLTVPPNSIGEVYLPTTDPLRVAISDVTNTKCMGMQGKSLVYEVNSGTYHFTIPTN